MSREPQVLYNQENQSDGKILVINPGDFSKDTLFASVNPLTLESNIYNLK